MKRTKRIIVTIKIGAHCPELFFTFVCKKYSVDETNGQR